MINKVKMFKHHVDHSHPHLYRVMQGWSSRMKGQILEGLDLRILPSSLFRPIDGQHVVWKLLAKHKGGGVWLWLRHRIPLDGKISSLPQINGEGEREREWKERGPGSTAGMWRGLYSLSLIEHAFDKRIWTHHASQALVKKSNWTKLNCNEKRVRVFLEERRRVKE